MTEASRTGGFFMEKCHGKGVKNMTIKANRQFLWGAMRKEARELHPGDQVVLESEPAFFEGDFMGSYVEVVDPDTVRLVEAYEVASSTENRAPRTQFVLLRGPEINERNLEGRAFLGGAVGYKQPIRWEPTPDLSPARRK